ncbi:MAG: hypothetical protein KF760_29315 [Candidatus Eremiobacteraeota bacterium]|nr:hypothetical protein [Candidatus Eremiobacteraeota bacterium]MCW5865926.1 hypothetical protein [Candidatus Eremiobacteraeota bacterium]
MADLRNSILTAEVSQAGKLDIASTVDPEEAYRNVVAHAEAKRAWRHRFR